MKSLGNTSPSTPVKVYRPTRLPFVVASAIVIFQSKIEQMLQGIPMIVCSEVCREDDIQVSGKNESFEELERSSSTFETPRFETQNVEVQIHEAISGVFRLSC